jgi:mevalonate kinase
MQHSAPGKLILCGEHAVVYRRPAIALPVAGVRAFAETRTAPRGAGLRFEAPDFGRSWALSESPDDPLSQLAAAALDELGISQPDVTLTIRSAIPIASGMGSGAAIATAVVRALAALAGRELAPAAVSSLVYQSERSYHGTPSGIDNTVVAFEQAIWFQRTGGPAEPQNRGTTEQRNQEPRTKNQLSAVNNEQQRDGQWVTSRQLPATSQASSPIIEPISIARPFTLLIGDTGVRSATLLPVGEVRRRREAEPEHYDALFDQIGGTVLQVRDTLASGNIPLIGSLLSTNQALLREIGVSSPELDRLVDAAVDAGALGAKLSGAGWGGVMIALVEEERIHAVQEALERAGAVRVLRTEVASSQ